MIKLLRVDYRLLHGQVAFNWTNAVKANCILVASDTVVNDDMWKTTLKLGKPSGVKLVIKNMADSIDAINSGKTDAYQLLIVVQTIKDAAILANACPQIKSINLGGAKKQPGYRQISNAVYVNDEDVDTIKNLVSKGIEVEIRQLANENKIQAENVI